MAAMCTGSSKTLTPHSIASNLRLQNAVTDGATTLTKVELPYLWVPKGRNKTALGAFEPSRSGDASADCCPYLSFANAPRDRLSWVGSCHSVCSH
jgi:hypothetical protein